MALNKEGGKRRKSMSAASWFGLLKSKRNINKDSAEDVKPANLSTSLRDMKKDDNSHERPMQEKYMSRRTSTVIKRPTLVQRKSFRTDKNKKLPMGYIQLRKATLNNSFTSTDQLETSRSSALASILLHGLKKDHLCDVTVIGKDGLSVKAPSFLLCSHSKVFEGMFSSTKKAASQDTDDISNYDSEHFVDASEHLTSEHLASEIKKDADGAYTVNISFASKEAILTVLHFMASHELPENRTADSSEANIRTLTQINVFALYFKMPHLSDEVYRLVRVLVNKTGRLASAVFDECSKSMKFAGMAHVFKTNELMAYVFESIREKPEEFLIVGGLQYLCTESIQKIICDQEIDVDEITMFHILFTWIREGPGEREDRLRIAKSLVSNIQLTLIDVKYLNTRVRYSGFVEASAVDDAIDKIEEHRANLSPEEQEHVLVTGAGTESVNGIYVRVEEDIGLEGDEAVFVKEAPEDMIASDYGLYLWKDSWAISPCVDYSRVLYSCYAENKRGWERLRPSSNDWTTVDGASPAPTCEWNAGANASDGKEQYIAPRLSANSGSLNMNVRDLECSLNDITDGDYAGAKEFSLDDMMNLPTDEDFEGSDYRVVRPTLQRDRKRHSGKKESLTQMMKK